MKYLALLGRQPELSAAELEALFGGTKFITPEIAEFNVTRAEQVTPQTSSPQQIINRLGGTIKLMQPLKTTPVDFLSGLPSGKITLGLSDFDHPNKSEKTAWQLKRTLARQGRSLRLIPNHGRILETAAILHNQLGQNPRKVELNKIKNHWYLTCGVQNIDAYTRRDQARPARDAKNGMLPPKLAQILINLCGPLPENARLLDPFCGTGVILQEATLMGYQVYGTDLSERMIEMSKENLTWLTEQRLTKSNQSVQSHNHSAQNHNQSTQNYNQSAQNRNHSAQNSDTQQNQTPDNPEIRPLLEPADATTYHWSASIDAVASETYLGPPLSQPPAGVRLKQIKQELHPLHFNFLKNLAPQLKSGTPVTLAIPAWLRPDGHYETLNLLDEINDLGYNEVKYHCQQRGGLVYYRPDQVVARQIITLRKI